jgi:hypothetical protein
MWRGDVLRSLRAGDGASMEHVATSHSHPDWIVGAMPEDPAASRLGGRPAQAAEALGLASEDIDVDVTSGGRDKRPAAATYPAPTRTESNGSRVRSAMARTLPELLSRPSQRNPDRCDNNSMVRRPPACDELGPDSCHR